MKYNYNKIVTTDYNSTLEIVTEKLKEQGFGIITEIDVKETFKKKLNVDFRKYKILGACNPTYAYKAITTEDKIGVFLPCNVIVQEREDGKVEVAAVSPKASMMAIDNPNLGEIAEEIEYRLKKVIDEL